MSAVTAAAIQRARPGLAKSGGGDVREEDWVGLAVSLWVPSCVNLELMWRLTKDRPSKDVNVSGI